MDVKDILQNKRPLKDQDELQHIKAYIKKTYNEVCNVGIYGNKIIITVEHAALASTLQLELSALQKACQTSKPIRLRIQNN